jgi:hypothetical protein
MRTIETTAVVTPEHTITVQLPPDIPPGSHRVVVVIERNGTAPPPVVSWREWAPHNTGPVDPANTFRREDLYGDDGH